MSDTPPSELIKSVITTYVGTTTWTIETGRMPDSPNQVVVLMDTGGEPANPKWLLDFPTVQIMVRGNVGGYLAAYALIKNLKDLCLGVNSQDIGTDRLVSVTQITDVLTLGNDDNDRPTFSLNLQLITEPGTSANTNRLAL